VGFEQADALLGGASCRRRSDSEFFPFAPATAGARFCLLSRLDNDQSHSPKDAERMSRREEFP
jgi:hypothetical protein